MERLFSWSLFVFSFALIVRCGNVFWWNVIVFILLTRKNLVILTYKKRWKASGCGCDPIKDWSLSVESSRSVVTPNGSIGATVASAANGIEWPATALGVWPPCDEWLFGSWIQKQKTMTLNSIERRSKKKNNNKKPITYCWRYRCTCSRQRFTFILCIGFVEWIAWWSRSLKWCTWYMLVQLAQLCVHLCCVF